MVLTATPSTSSVAGIGCLGGRGLRASLVVVEQHEPALRPLDAGELEALQGPRARLEQSEPLTGDRGCDHQAQFVDELCPSSDCASEMLPWMPISAPSSPLSSATNCSAGASTIVEAAHLADGADEVKTYFGTVLMKEAKGSKSDDGQWSTQ